MHRIVLKMEGASSMQRLSHVSEDLECPLCLQLYRNARSLLCLHTFCQDCLVKYQSKQRYKNVLVCPTCRESTSLPSGSVSSLRLNTVINRVTDTWRSAAPAGGFPMVDEGDGRKWCNGSSIRSPCEGAMCPAHKNETLTQYCCICMMAVCRDCIMGDHRNHNFEDLETTIQKMREDIKSATSVTGSFLPKLEKVRMVLKQKEKEIQLSEGAAALMKEINMAADSAIDFVNDEINRQREALLATIDALSSASSGALTDKMKQDALTTFNLAQAVIDAPQKKTLTNVEMASIYPELRRKLGNIVDSCLEGGLLDAMNGLQVPTFSPNTQLLKQVNLGRMNHPRSWRLVRTLNIPDNRVGETISMKVTPDDKLGIGYKNGGVDIVDPLLPGEHQSILPDVKIFDFAFMQNDTVAVVTLSRKLLLFNQKNIQLDVTFNTPTTSGLMSVDVDDDGCLIVGFAEHKSIHVYSPKGGDPIKVIDLDDFDPWRVTATKLGRIITKNLNSVKIYDRSGDIKATISETPPLCISATTDKTGAIFVVVLRKSEQISVAKHRFDGSLEETIMTEQAVYKINNEKYWFSLAALSRDCLAVSDTRNVFIYRNAPVLPDLIKLAK